MLKYELSRHFMNEMSTQFIFQQTIVLRNTIISFNEIIVLRKTIVLKPVLYVL